MDSKIVYLPEDILNLRHLKRYDHIKLDDLLRRPHYLQLPKRDHFPIGNSIQPAFYPVSAFILVHHQQEYQHYQREYQYNNPSYTHSPMPLHNLNLNSSYAPGIQPQLYTLPLSPISPLQHSPISITMPVIQINPSREVPIGCIPVYSFPHALPFPHPPSPFALSIPPPPPPPPMEPGLRYFSPISPQKNEDFIKMTNPVNNNIGLKENTENKDQNSINDSSISTSSSSDIIIQI